MNVQGGQLTQTNGNPAQPGTLLTGPLLAGNIQSSDGTTNLAGAGALAGGMANVGYAVMAQADDITQATNGGSAGVFTSTQIIIPAQSLVLRIGLLVTAAWTGAALTLGIGDTTSATSFTGANAGSASALGWIWFTPGSGSTQVGNWGNTGSSDRQIVVTSANTGNGAGKLVFEYAQGINL